MMCGNYALGYTKSAFAIGGVSVSGRGRGLAGLTLVFVAPAPPHLGCARLVSPSPRSPQHPR